MPRAWANAILKLNRSQLKNRNIRKWKDVLDATSKKTTKKFKELTPTELQYIKSKIQQEAKEAKKQENTRYMGAFLLAFFLIWIIKSIF